MHAKQYQVTLKGVTPLLMHNDDVTWADQLAEWLKIPANKKSSNSGDDRSPAWKWIGYLYYHNGTVCMPSDNLMSMLRQAGTKLLTGKGKQTYKAQTQYGIVVDELGWPLEVRGGYVSQSKIEELMDEPEYPKHEQAVQDMGFELFAKRAKIGNSKHIRVRPKFTDWACSGTITVIEDSLTPTVLQDIFTQGGMYVGLCDWRPSSPTPGRFGRFEATVKPI